MPSLVAGEEGEEVEEVEDAGVGVDAGAGTEVDGEAAVFFFFFLLFDRSRGWRCII